MSKVVGIEAFSKAMAHHKEEFVLIGGGACSVLFDEVGRNFRATQDLDIVILVDKATPSFAKDFWTFVTANGYSAWKRSEGGCAYYRFNLPAKSDRTESLPAQIELFARHPNFTLEDESSEITPLPFDEAVSSLSAIILDDGYYEFIRNNVVSVLGIPLLSALYIIPLKMRAHVDLSLKYADGLHVNSKDLRKHRADVSSLTSLLPDNASLPLSGQMRDDAESFMADFEQYVERQTNRKTRGELAETLRVLRRVYLA